MKIAQYFGDKPNDNGVFQGYDNGSWQSVLKIPYIQKIEEAEQYDVIIRTLWIEATVGGWSAEIRKRYPHVVQIGLSDHPLSTHISKMPAPQQVAYFKDLESLDGIMALTEEEREFYQTAIPSKPVIKGGLPFPFESYEATFGKYRDSDKKYIGLGVGASDNDRNFISNILVFERLRMDDPSLVGVFLSIPETLMPYCTYLADKVENVYIQQRTGMSDYYDILSQCKVVINLADRNTPGRLQGEAAFFGVPVVGSDRFELQNELFPSLATTPYALEHARSLVEGLLADPEYSKTLTDLAYQKLHKYDFQSSKRKFNKLLKQIRG